MRYIARRLQPFKQRRAAELKQEMQDQSSMLNTTRSRAALLGRGDPPGIGEHDAGPDVVSHVDGKNLSGFYMQT